MALNGKGQKLDKTVKHSDGFLAATELLERIARRNKPDRQGGRDKPKCNIDGACAYHDYPATSEHDGRSRNQLDV
jgi:hypothetical protein